MRRKSRERASEGDDDDAASNMMEYEPFDPQSAVPRNRKLTLLKIAALLAIGFLIFVSIRGITSSSGSTNNLQGLAEDAGPFHAYVQLRVGKTEAKMGTLLLVQQAAGEPVTVTGKITGLSPNAKHGFHVHVFGDFRNGCESVGPHFNPFNKVHGAPTDQERHVGDLGNVETNSSGTANVEITDTLIALAPGPTSIIGRSFVVHSGTDDLGKGNFEDSLTTGHAGVKYGCGVVAITSN